MGSALKLSLTAAADDSCFSGEIRLDISCESSARQRIHMKHQALFLGKIKVKI